MSNYNKVLLLGRLTRDPELRSTPQGTSVVDIGVAVNREYTVGTERRKETTFVDVTLWKRQAEVVSQYLRKGSPIFIEGRLSLDSWEQDGQKRSRLRVVAENFQFVGGRSDGEAGGGGEGSGYRGGSRYSSPSATRDSGPGSDSGRGSYDPSRDSHDTSPPGRPLPPEEPGSEGEIPLGIDESEIPF